MLCCRFHVCKTVSLHHGFLRPQFTPSVGVCGHLLSSTTPSRLEPAHPHAAAEVRQQTGKILAFPVRVGSAPRHPPRSLRTESGGWGGWAYWLRGLSSRDQRAVTLLSRFIFPANWHASTFRYPGMAHHSGNVTTSTEPLDPGDLTSSPLLSGLQVR